MIQFYSMSKYIFFSLDRISTGNQNPFHWNDGTEQYTYIHIILPDDIFEHPRYNKQIFGNAGTFHTLSHTHIIHANPLSHSQFIYSALIPCKYLL